MAIRVVAMLAIILILAGFVVVCSVGFSKRKKVMQIVGAVGTVASLLAFIAVPFSIYTVDTGEVAVVKFLGQANNVRYAGTYFDFWITKTYQKYDSKTQTISIKTATYSSDAQTMDIQMTVQYKILADKAIKIAEQYGSLDVLQDRIESVNNEKLELEALVAKQENVLNKAQNKLTRLKEILNEDS